MKIGWRPFYKEHYYQTPCFIIILNFIYPILIVSLLCYAYVYDVVTCQAKLNIALDTQVTKKIASMFLLRIVKKKNPFFNGIRYEICGFKIKTIFFSINVLSEEIRIVSSLITILKNNKYHAIHSFLFELNEYDQ